MSRERSAAYRGVHGEGRPFDIWANVIDAGVHVYERVYLPPGTEWPAETEIPGVATRLLEHAPPFLFLLAIYLFHALGFFSDAC